MSDLGTVILSNALIFSTIFVIDQKRVFQNFEKIKSCGRVRGGVMIIWQSINGRTDLNGSMKWRKKLQQKTKANKNYEKTFKKNEKLDLKGGE